MTRHLKQFKALMPLAVALLFFAALFVVAPEVTASSAMDNLNKIGETGYGADTSQDPQSQLVGSIAIMIKSFLGLMGVVLVVITLYGGFLWMTAGGNEEKVTKLADEIDQLPAYQWLLSGLGLQL